MKDTKYSTDILINLPLTKLSHYLIIYNKAIKGAIKAEEKFEGLDKDKSGFIEPGEIKGRLEKNMLKDMEKMKCLQKKIESEPQEEDTEKTKKMVEEKIKELQNALDRLDEITKNYIAKFDKNKDGKISLDEYQKAVFEDNEKQMAIEEKKQNINFKGFNESLNKFIEEANLEIIEKTLEEFTKGKNLNDPKEMIAVLTAINKDIMNVKNKKLTPEKKMTKDYLTWGTNYIHVSMESLPNVQGLTYLLLSNPNIVLMQIKQLIPKVMEAFIRVQNTAEK